MSALITKANARNAELTGIFVAVGLALTQLIQLRIVGTLYLHDLVSPLLMVVLILGKRDVLAVLRPLRVFLILSALWLGGAIMTDIIVHSAFADYSRGWLRIILLVVNVVAIWLLAHGRLRILGAYILASGIVLALRTWLFPSEFAIEDPWKFGYGTALLYVVGGLSTSATVRRAFGNYAIPALFLLLGAVSLIRNSRSSFAIAELSGLYAFLATWIVARPDLARRITPAWFVTMLVGGMFVAQALTGIYANAAVNGALGAEARAKYLAQTNEDTSIILGGRPESLVSVRAIADSPFIGHGSWARDHYYTLVYFQELRRRGLTVAPSVNAVTAGTEDLIQTHSHLLGSWVEAGILSVPFWLWVIGLCGRALYSALKARAMPSALIALTAMMVLWDTLFSPFAADARIIKAAQICILLLAIEIARASARATAVPSRARVDARYRPVPEFAKMRSRLSAFNREF